jgi:hypothetical protein
VVSFAGLIRLFTRTQHQEIHHRLGTPVRAKVVRHRTIAEIACACIEITALSISVPVRMRGLMWSSLTALPAKASTSASSIAES